MGSWDVYDLPNCPISDSLSCPKSDRFSVQRCGYAPGACAPGSIISKVKAIFNAKNFGQFNSPFYGMCQTTGDCTICLCCDFQDPVELIPTFVKEWESGYKIVS